jgi:hypothetical protein
LVSFSAPWAACGHARCLGNVKDLLGFLSTLSPFSIQAHTYTMSLRRESDFVRLKHLLREANKQAEGGRKRAQEADERAEEERRRAQEANERIEQ